MSLPAEPEGPRPLDPAQHAALAGARQSARRFRFAAGLARWNGVCLLLSAALCLCSAVFDTSLFGAVLLFAATGLVELRARRELRAYRPKSLLWLAGNQLALLCAVGVYAALQLHAVMIGPASLAAELARHPELGSLLEAIDRQQLEAALGSFDALYRTGVELSYASLLVATVLCQGGAALYYFTRHARLLRFVAETPAWVLEQLRAR